MILGVFLSLCRSQLLFSILGSLGMVFVKTVWEKVIHGDFFLSDTGVKTT